MKMFKKKKSELDLAIEREIKALDKTNDSDEYAVHLKTLTELLKMKTTQSDVDSKKIERIADIGVKIVGVVLPIMVYSKWMKVGFKFEETGSLSSTTFREARNKIRLK